MIFQSQHPRISAQFRHFQPLICFSITLAIPFMTLRYASAQIGFSVAQLEQGIRLQPAEYRDELLYRAGLTGRVGHPIGAQNLTFVIGIRNDVAECIVPLHGNANAAAQVLDHCSWQIKDGKAARIQWVPADTFLTAFPPIGKSYFRLSVVSSRTVGTRITFKRSSGQIVGRSPIRDSTLAPSRIATGTNVYTLVSQDGTAYFQATIFYHQRAFETHDGGSLVFIKDYAICSPYAFWVKTSQAIRALKGDIGQKRMAGLIVSFIDTAALTTNELLNIANPEFAVAGAPLRNEVHRLLGERIVKQAPQTQRQRMRFLASVFSSDAIDNLIPLTQRPGNIGTEATLLLARIANENGLQQPPANDARISEWREWRSAID